jgi:hypothetical protein
MQLAVLPSLIPILRKKSEIVDDLAAPVDDCLSFEFRPEHFVKRRRILAAMKLLRMADWMDFDYVYE